MKPEVFVRYRVQRSFPVGGATKEVFRRLSIGGLTTAIALSVLVNRVSHRPFVAVVEPEPVPEVSFPPLIMRGGDPHIRALMRTISAAESNVSRPYHVLYGGEYIEDLSRHPDRCIRIPVGPNTGNCSTAAGRYQMLTTTWNEKSELYHPKAEGFWLWDTYHFEPEYQDRVVHDWLSDRVAWGEDIAALLRQGQLDKVLRLLSGTWTSLGYGIETNDMTQSLPQIYERMLAQELESLTAGEAMDNEQ